MKESREWAFESAIIEHQFLKLTNYFHKISSYIINEKDIKEITMSEDDAFDFYENDSYVIEMVYQQFCYSMIININTLIENYIGRIKRIIRNKKINYDINKAKQIILIKQIKAIRNVIAHENGELRNTRKDDINIIKGIIKNQEIPGFKIINSDSGQRYQRLKFNLDSVIYCLQTGKKELQNIIQQIKNVTNT
jgi:hypothetical protein